MSTSKIKRRLRDAEKLWKKEIQNPDIDGLPGYMPGVLKGFAETLKIVEEYQREELNKAISQRRPLSRRTALMLLLACQRAYGRLVYSERKGAMKTLKKVMDKTRS